VEALSPLYRTLCTTTAARREATAVVDVDGRSATYRGLFAQADEVRRGLRQTGVAPRERVGVLARDRFAYLPMLLGVLAENVAVPLPYSATADELDRAIATSRTSAVVGDQAGVERLSRGARTGFARRRVAGRPGWFGVAVLRRRPEADATRARLILQTSGTTAAPKAVGLDDSVLLAGMTSVRRSVSLTRDDVCLNVMPMTHTLGLVTGALLPLWIGGKVVVGGGPQADAVAAWLERHQVTWYSVVPPVHEAMLGACGPTFEPHSLRFVRSSAAPLPQALALALEEKLRVPVVEAYAMTEAPGEISSTSLPARRKPGTVGRPRACEIRVRDDGGRLAGPGEPGEIEISGPNVIRSYLDGSDPEAFREGWLRTGDLGLVDEDGDLVLTGRLKELINCGGEKVSPAEIEAATLTHRAVREAAAFGVPHMTMGEQVALAIVAHDRTAVDAHEIKAHLAVTLSRIKLPRRIVFVESLPRTETGKVDRPELARCVGAT
jgi:acyl-CoA synthetase (AMP-forming)/AMP-acid ligase II